MAQAGQRHGSDDVVGSETIPVGTFHAGLAGRCVHRDYRRVQLNMVSKKRCHGIGEGLGAADNVLYRHPCWAPGGRRFIDGHGATAGAFQFVEQPVVLLGEGEKRGVLRCPAAHRKTEQADGLVGEPIRRQMMAQ